MATWLFTWNPDKTPWEGYDKDCEAASKENPLDFNWSSQSKQTQAGDEFFLFKQGKLPRGIIAHGFLTGGTSDEDHWDEEKARAGKKAHYVDGECDVLLNYKTQDILNLSVLEEECPGQQWSPYASGIHIKDEVLPKLHELWAGVTMEYPDNPEESVYEEEIKHADKGTADSVTSETDTGEDAGEEGTTTSGIVEGTKKTVYTTTYERNPKIRRAFLKGKKKLQCEVCGFDFEKSYGKLGAGFIEVHHKKPVSEGVHMTDLNNDLVMLCSNCHRMIHRGVDHMITVEELKGVIQDSAKSTSSD